MWHHRLVEAACMGCVFPLVVDKFGVWTPSSIEVFHSIVHSSTASNGPPVGTDFCHLVEQLSVQLCCYGISGHFTFTFEDDWYGTCAVWNSNCLYISHDSNDMADTIDD